MAISSSPIISYLKEEANPILITIFLQEVVECHKVSPEPPLLQTQQPELPQVLFLRLVLQALHQFCCPFLDTLQGHDVLCVMRGPKLNTALKVQPHQS